MRQRERKFWLQELFDIRSLDILCSYFSNFDDMDRMETSSVLSSKILVTSDDSIGTGQFTIFLVHVVGTRSGVITNPDTKVFNLCRFFLVNLSLACAFKIL